MKQKLVVAMSVLGLISCSEAFAATQAKHKSHHKVKHHAASASHDYKDMGGIPVQAAPVAMVEACPLVSMTQTVMDSMSQNMGRAKPTVDCFKPISFAGGLNFDSHFGNRSQGYNGENVQRFSVNDAYLNIFGNVNDWTKAFMSASYNNASVDSTTAKHPGEYNAVDNTEDKLSLEQAFITFANFNASPVFVKVGKDFQDFGRYQIHPLTRSMTQVMSESLRTSIQVGAVTAMGLHGSIYGFDDALNKNTESHAKTDFGAAVGFAQPSDQLGYDLGVGYVSNLTAANDVQTAVTTFNGTNNYVHSVGGVAVYGDVNSGPFSVSARYTTALQSFSNVDLTTGTTANEGAKPWAADLQAGYGFNAMSKNQNVYLGYQASNEAVNLFLPKSRWLVGYGVDMWKNTTLGAEVAHDRDYNVSHGGTGNTSNTIGVRASVKFG